MDYKDYYKILGVSKKATKAEIKKKFRKLAIKYHPDKSPNNATSESKFKEVNEAYEVLGDDEKRKKYDALGSNWKNMMGNQGYRNHSSSRQSYKYSGEYGDFFSGSDSFSDFFAAFFGSGKSQFSGSAGQYRKTKSPTSKVILRIGFNEALKGGSKVVSVGGEKIRLKLKPGLQNGQKLKLKDKGSGRQDILLVIEINESSRYTKSGLNLNAVQNIDLYSAVLGGKVEVETPYGGRIVNLLPGTQNGKKIRLKGVGYPDYDNPNKRGDLLLEIMVQIPKVLTDRQKKLFEELGKINKSL